VAVGHHRLMCGVGKVSTVLEMTRRLAVMSRCLLVMRRRGFEMTLLAVLRVHAGSCAIQD
jgi:acetolactate synthase regulatory subunit